MTTDEKKKTILLVDDDTSLLVTLGDFLRYEGYAVITADCAEQALKRLEKITPDLVILDMSMPGMGGIGFLREVSTPSGKPRYPVLVLTARANMADFFANVEVAGFIAKPCSPDDLLMEVGRIVFLTSGEPEPPATARHRRVLIGEDDAGIRRRLADAFTEEGYATDTAERGPEVVERAVLNRPDVIVMKRVFSGMNGDAVAQMLREMPNTKDVPVVLYDDSDTTVPESKTAEWGTGSRRFVRGSRADRVVAAAREVVGM